MDKLIVMSSKFVSSSSSWLNSLLCLVSLFLHLVMAKLIIIFSKVVSSSLSWLNSLLCLVSLFLSAS